MLGPTRRPIQMWGAATFYLIKRSRCLRDIDRALHATIYMSKLAYNPYGMSRTAFATEDDLWERDLSGIINLEEIMFVKSTKNML